MNKKGFTLAELILVIVLIAVLSLLASTTVINQMNRTGRDAALRNAISYVNAINDYNFVSEGEDVITSGNTSTITPQLKDSFDGTKPTSGTVTVNATTKKVTSAELHFNSYVVTYNGSNYSISNQ